MSALGAAKLTAQPVRVTQSTEGEYWKSTGRELTREPDPSLPVISLERNYEQIIDGFGACFNELGWEAFEMLPAKQRNELMAEFFSPEGFNFSICRMPIGANDYARNFYSHNYVEDDFAMKHFNIDRDRTALVPYIKMARQYNPGLAVWASPWCPPVWMKTNHHYACRPGDQNDLEEEQAGGENSTQFIMEPDYLEAYARYFVKFIRAYANEGIPLYAVHVQNEPNSCQVFPSCIWTSEDLATFIGDYLGPAFDTAGLDTEIWLGTIERPSVEKVDTVLHHPRAGNYIRGVGFQWAGKKAIPGVHRKYPEMPLMQTESECGDGSNDWVAAEYTWSLIRHYLENGANSYLYWNMILDETGRSRWGWKQNSLVSVDSKTGAFTRNPEFYLFRHLTHFVQPGARKLQTPAGAGEALLFENPDGQLVLLAVNTTGKEVKRQFRIRRNGYLQIDVEPHSFQTVVVQE